MTSARRNTHKNAVFTWANSTWCGTHFRKSRRACDVLDSHMTTRYGARLPGYSIGYHFYDHTDFVVLSWKRNGF